MTRATKQLGAGAFVDRVLALRATKPAALKEAVKKAETVVHARFLARHDALLERVPEDLRKAALAMLETAGGK